MRKIIRIIAILVFFATLATWAFTDAVTATVAIAILAVSGIVAIFTASETEPEHRVMSSKDKVNDRFQNRYDSGLRGDDLTKGLYDNL